MIADDRSFIPGSILTMFAIALFTAGCATKGPILSSTIVESPLSNQNVAQLVLNEALGRVPLTNLAGQAVAVSCTGDSVSAELAIEIVTDLLTAAGGLIDESGDAQSRLTVSIETLTVGVIEHTSLFGHKSIDRQATASLRVDVDAPQELKRTYEVYGSYFDQPDDGYAGISSEQQPSYVIINRKASLLGTYGKPIGLTVFMTVLVWTLYSYRG